MKKKTKKQKMTLKANTDTGACGEGEVVSKEEVTINMIETVEGGNIIVDTTVKTEIIVSSSPYKAIEHIQTVEYIESVKREEFLESHKTEEITERVKTEPDLKEHVPSGASPGGDSMSACLGLLTNEPKMKVGGKVKGLPRVVYYDLETTGLGFHNKHRDIEIVEIGAVDGETKETFRQYMLPPGNKIPRDASNVHGIYLRDGALYRDDMELESVDCKTGLQNFLTWLTSFKQPITLAGYNSHNFDDWVISHNLLREGLCARGGGSVVKFLDVAKIVRPYLKSTLGVRKWSLTFAVKTCLERGQSDAHSAVSDSIDTLDLMLKMKDEKAPEKAFRESDYVQNMCVRIAQGLPIEEPQNESKTKSNKPASDQKVTKKNKSPKPTSDQKVVDKKQPLMVAFFKVIPNQKKAVTDEEKGVSVDKVNKHEEKNKENFVVKKGKRKANVLVESNESDHPFGQKKRSKRAPRAPRAPRESRKRTKEN